MCGVGSLRIVGQVSDATTGEPVEGAWIYYTPLGTTYPGADEDKPAMRESRGEPVGRSDATGRIDLSYEYGFSLEVPINKAAADATDAEEAELRDRVVQSVSENSESIYCIDVSRAGYRSWVTVVESNDPRYVDGALRLGTIELVSIGGTQ
jgi:hypothetical protein